MIVTYYKATQPDGLSFQGDPKVCYEVGATVYPAALAVSPRMCGPGYLHAADAEGETLVGGAWPCRLFEVEGSPAAGFDSEHGHKGGFLSLTVVREIEAHRALGPNGAQVAAFIERLKATTKDDWTIIIRERQRAAAARDAVWAAAWDAARAAAWDAAWDAARDAAWDAARAAARDAVWAAARDAARAAARDAAWDAARAAAWDAARDAAWAAAWDAARDAARDAALALLARDLITEEQFSLLYAPFEAVIPVESLAIVTKAQG